jgi:hypothetical protein
MQKEESVGLWRGVSPSSAHLICVHTYIIAAYIGL